MNLLKSLTKRINSIYLCIRFPFLWPRNRFSGLHYTNFKLQELINRFYKFAINTIYVSYEKRPEKIDYWFGSRFNDLFYQPTVIDGKFYLIRDNHKIEIPIPNCRWCWVRSRKNDNTIIIYYDEECEHTFKVIEDVYSKSAYIIYKALNWIYHYPMQWIHSIPSYTELDAMPEGWRKTFGIKLCKELKAILKKHNCLKSFRVTQIKEKFGTLRFYANNCPREAYELLDRYEDESMNVCINCGKPTKYVTKGWITYICEDCARNKQNVELITNDTVLL